MAGGRTGRGGSDPPGGGPAAARIGAWGAALKLLALRARSTREVQDTLRRRGYPPEEIAKVIARLHAARYLDDAEFARSWVSSRIRRAPAGPTRLARELRAKGIGAAEIAAALGAVAEEWDPVASAEEAVRRKLKSLSGAPPDVARRRLAAHLERRGFDPGIILAMCRKHIPGSDDPTRSP